MASAALPCDTVVLELIGRDADQSLAGVFRSRARAFARRLAPAVPPPRFLRPVRSCCYSPRCRPPTLPLPPTQKLITHVCHPSCLRHHAVLYPSSRMASPDQVRSAWLTNTEPVASYLRIMFSTSAKGHSSTIDVSKTERCPRDDADTNVAAASDTRARQRLEKRRASVRRT
jgi:hypothetical protein